MTIHQADLARLADKLRTEYLDAPRGAKMTALHLFGLENAGELAGLNGRELEIIAEAAGSVSFATELRKMVKLAPYVSTKRADSTFSEVFKRLARPLPDDYKFDRDEANAR